MRRLALSLGALAFTASLVALLLADGGHGPSPGLRLGATALLVAGAGLGLRGLPRWRPLIPWLAALPGLALLAGARPSQERSWSPDQRVLPWAELGEDQVTIHRVRNFRYRSEDDWDERWYDATYRLDELQRVWFIVEKFGPSRAAAHAMVSFEFGGDRFVALSVEIRKERGESFSPLRGVLRNYELMYVWGDERDLIELRTNFRHDPLWLHPSDVSQQAAQRYLLSLLRRTNELREQPAFYNTALSSCSTNLADHLQAVSPEHLALDWRTRIPGYTDELAWELGLLAGDGPWQELRERHEISARALAAGDSDDFSVRIREGIER